MNADEKAKRLARLSKTTEQAAPDADAVFSDTSDEVQSRFNGTAEQRSFRTLPSASRKRKRTPTHVSESRPESSKGWGSALVIDLTDDAPVKDEGQGMDRATLRYPHGKVMLTKADTYRIEQHHISIEELFDRQNLRRAVLSSYVWDMEWLFTKLDVGKTAIHMIYGAKGPVEKEGLMRLCEKLPKLYGHYPPMANANIMHSKLQLLFFDNFLRLVIPSANLIPHDWGESGLMENIVFVQDFPRVRPAGPDDDTEDESSEHGRTEFLQDLKYFLQRSRLSDTIIAELEHYDLSDTSRIRFVSTIGGATYGDDMYRVGLCRLAKAVQSLRLPLSRVQVGYVTSSLGALNPPFPRALMNACTGLDSSDIYKDAGTVAHDISRDLKIYFPTTQEVRGSRATRADTVCFQSSFFRKPTFPKQSLLQHVPVRPRLLSHCKIIVCRAKDDPTIGWAYVGSANLSASAWGDRIAGKKGKNRQGTHSVVCRNWESGLLLPLSWVEKILPIREDTQVNSDPWFFLEA